MNTDCENCKFWQQDNEISYMGLCRRHAPHPPATHPVESPGSMDAIWPRTKNEDWCGEWQAKVETGEVL